MKIYPKIGLDNLRLGMSRKQVSELIGLPVSKENNAEEEVWEFENEIELSFQSEDNYLLGTITVSNSGALFESQPIIGINEQELLSRFPHFEIDEDFGRDGKSYWSDELEMMAWVFEGEVFNISIFPEYDESNELPIWPK